MVKVQIKFKDSFVTPEPRKKSRPYFPLNPGCVIGILIGVY